MLLSKILFEEIDTSNQLANEFAAKLNGFETHSQVVNFTKTLKYLGYGRYRDVFDLENGLALKVAADKYEITENRNEIDAKACLADEYFTKLYAYDDNNFWWLIVEKISTENTGAIRSAIMKNLEGSEVLSRNYNSDLLPEKIYLKDLPMDKFFVNLARHLAFLASDQEQEEDEKPRSEVVRSPWLKGLVEQLKQCGVAPHDLHQENWGLRSDGSPVILDYGFASV